MMKETNSFDKFDAALNHALAPSDMAHSLYLTSEVVNQSLAPGHGSHEAATLMLDGMLLSLRAREATQSGYLGLNPTVVYAELRQPAVDFVRENYGSDAIPTVGPPLTPGLGSAADYAISVVDGAFVGVLDCSEQTV